MPESGSWTSALLVSALVLSCAASAQQPRAPAIRAPAPKTDASAPATTIKVQVNQVLVPVVVTDKRGHNVTGLKVKDFEVLENGVEQKVSAFQTENDREPEDIPAVPIDPNIAPAQAAPKSEPNAKAHVRRTYLICLDTINSSFSNFTYVRGALHKLFKQEDGGDSLYAILTMGRTLAVPQNLTSDPATVLSAIGSKELTRAIQQSESMNLKHQEDELNQMLEDYCGRCPCAGSAAATGRMATGSDTVCDGKLEKIEMWAGSAAEERSFLTRSFLQNLRAVVSRMSQMPGKRILVFVSDGFNTHPGRDLFGVIAAYTRDPGVMMNSSINDAEPEIQDILRIASAHDVVFYTLDSRGLTPPGGGTFDASEEAHLTRASVIMPEILQQKETTEIENQEPLAELAQATGGVFFHNNNDLFKGMKQAFADGREYYLLAYVSTNQATDGKFREIKVIVNGKNLTVRAKHGYWAPAG
ncbi:MAG TPA: VWA domain-containing protein [Terriglobia bacterium]|nr:VWA domain-containing protein [Terriglobia bacterium]